MAKKKKAEEPKRMRYHFYCHVCGRSLDTNTFLDVCECGGKIFTYTDYVEPKSRYVVNGKEK